MENYGNHNGFTRSLLLLLLVLVIGSHAVILCPEDAAGVKLWSSASTWPTGVPPTGRCNPPFFAFVLIIAAH